MISFGVVRTKHPSNKYANITAPAPAHTQQILPQSPTPSVLCTAPKARYI